jgi:hypothetical protein
MFCSKCNGKSRRVEWVGSTGPELKEGKKVFISIAANVYYARNKQWTLEKKQKESRIGLEAVMVGLKSGLYSSDDLRRQVLQCCCVSHGVSSITC